MQDLDFSTLEKLNNSHITDDLRERADDLVWRVKFRGQWFYLYLLIDERSFDAAELERLQNLTAVLIRAELADGPEALARVVANLIVWLDQDRQAELVSAFNEWTGRILIRNRVEGIELGEARMLKRLLSRRFGQMPQWAVERIDNARGEQLELWIDSVLEVDTLEDALS